MADAKFAVSLPENEKTREYRPGSPEYIQLTEELKKMKRAHIEIPLIIGGREIKTGTLENCVLPHEHGTVIGSYHCAGEHEVELAVEAALEARREWSAMDWAERVSIFLKAAEIIAGPRRCTLNAATMLCQSKTVFQAEIDAACELVDFLRFNSYFLARIYEEQPLYSFDGIWNRMEYRPLEGFVFAVTPFNFLSIAGNLPSAPAIAGNVSLWKPASSAVYSAYRVMQVFQEAGLPDGVINFIPGPGSRIGPLVLDLPDLAGIHFTGSTGTLQSMWAAVGKNIAKYRTYPRIVGETGGKDFIVAHASAESGFFMEELKTVKMGDIGDFSCFMGAVIDRNAFEKIFRYIEYIRKSNEAQIIFGGGCDDSRGYFIEPTVVVTTNPKFRTMSEEIFGPVLTVYVFEDDAFEEALHLCDQTSPYGLTGAVFARDRRAITAAQKILVHAAGNFYINDKPTGAVVGQQPFGGARASGTNDKAGSMWNMVRWVSPRSIKETFIPPADYRYPHMASGN